MAVAIPARWLSSGLPRQHLHFHVALVPISYRFRRPHRQVKHQAREKEQRSQHDAKEPHKRIMGPLSDVIRHPDDAGNPEYANVKGE
jgi:hypothetical protein